MATTLIPSVRTSVRGVFANGKELPVWKPGIFDTECTKVFDKDGKPLAVYQYDKWWLLGNGIFGLTASDEDLYISPLRFDTPTQKGLYRPDFVPLKTGKKQKTYNLNVK